MKRLSFLIAIVAVFAISGSALAGHHPRKKDVKNATPATYNAGWTSAASRDGGANAQSIKLGDGSNDATMDAYYTFPKYWEQKLTDVKRIEASFLAAPGTVNAGGSPRINVEVQNADGTQFCLAVCDGNNPVAIFLDPAHCGNAAAGGWVDSDFIRDRTNCTIFDNAGHSYSSSANKSAWDKLVKDPFYAGKRVWFVYLLQEAAASSGPNYVDRIQLDGVKFTKQP
jgi:hypothetical protein